MRKLLITIDYPPNVGGVARYLESYAKKHGLDVLCPKRSLQTSIFDRTGSRVFRKKLLWGGRPKWLPLLYWTFMYRKKYDEFVISHILPVGYAGLLTKKPYSIILHGLDILSANKTKWKKKWAKRILDSAKHIIVNSRATGELLRKIFGDLYNYQINYPLIAPLKKPTRSLREKQGWQNKKIILSLGRLVKRKGQEKIIKLMPKILVDEPNTIFVIAGQGSYKNDLEELSRDLRLKNKVIFLEKVADEDLPNLYSMCDIFALTAIPSKDNWEGFGMVCLEAAYFSKPVIVTNVGGLSEAVEEGITGFVVNNDEELFKKILELLKDENLRFSLGDEGRARVEERFLIK